MIKFDAYVRGEGRVTIPFKERTKEGIKKGTQVRVTITKLVVKEAEG